VDAGAVIDPTTEPQLSNNDNLSTNQQDAQDDCSRRRVSVSSVVGDVTQSIIILLDCVINDRWMLSTDRHAQRHLKRSKPPSTTLAGEREHERGMAHACRNDALTYDVFAGSLMSSIFSRWLGV